MTVKELIEILKTFPPTMTVNLDSYDQYYKDITDWDEQDYMCLDMLIMKRKKNDR